MTTLTKSKVIKPKKEKVEVVNEVPKKVYTATETQLMAASKHIDMSAGFIRMKKRAASHHHLKAADIILSGERYLTYLEYCKEHGLLHYAWISSDDEAFIAQFDSPVVLEQPADHHHIEAEAY